MTTDSSAEKTKSDAVGDHAGHRHDVPIVNVRDEEETLRRVEGVLLEVDESDSLFGKRTGVKDSHDRY